MKRTTLREELRYHFHRLGWAEVVPAEQYNAGEGGYLIEIAARCKGAALDYEPLRWPQSGAIAFWSDRVDALAFLADALEDL